MHFNGEVNYSLYQYHSKACRIWRSMHAMYTNEAILSLKKIYFATMYDNPVAMCRVKLHVYYLEHEFVREKLSVKHNI